MIARTQEEADAIEKGLRALVDKGIVSEVARELEERALERYCVRNEIPYVPGSYPPNYPCRHFLFFHNV